MNSLLRLQDISKSYRGITLFEHVSFSVNSNDCIGITGPNGCGKTTLFHVISGLVLPGDGELWKKEPLHLRSLSQTIMRPSEQTVEEYLWNNTQQDDDVQQQLQVYEKQLEDPTVYSTARYKEILEKMELLQKTRRKTDNETRFLAAKKLLEEIGLGNISLSHKLSMLSGGEQRKVMLACVFAQPENCDLLLLDEPTNHLDIETIEWLERYIADFPGALMIISHDGYLLDNLVDRVFDFRGSQIEIFDMSYEDYEQQRQMRNHVSQEAYRKAKAELRRQRESIQRMSRRNRFDKQITSKLKRLQRVKMPDNPIMKDYFLRFHFQSIKKTGKNIADGVELSKRFNDTVLLEEARFEILSGQKIGLIGRNGCGKTTFLRMLLEKEPVDKGKIQRSKGVQWGYFDQGHLALHLENTLVQEVLRDQPGLKETDAKALLGQFQFKDDMIWKEVKMLSGGERARLAFLRLLLQPYHVLLLDEPTNHMDMQSKTAIEQALLAYAGTVVVVSHDRRFLDAVVDRIFLMSNGKIHMFKGNYSEFRGQLHREMDRISQEDLVYGAGGSLEKYVVKHSFTEWSTRKKYQAGEEVLIGDHNRQLFAWALSSGKLQPLKRRP
jgi:ATP-binding cassette subfamily F protein 3